MVRVTIEAASTWPAIVSAIATAVLVGVTVVYVRLTRSIAQSATASAEAAERSAKSAETSAQISERSLKLAVLPIVSGRKGPVSNIHARGTRLSVEVHNVSNQPAFNLQGHVVARGDTPAEVTFQIAPIPTLMGEAKTVIKEDTKTALGRVDSVSMSVTLDYTDALGNRYRAITDSSELISLYEVDDRGAQHLIFAQEAPDE